MSDMRYEPGNWGDVLKGIWVDLIVRDRAARAVRPYRVADTFAGHPVYALTSGTRARLDELGNAHPYVTMQAPFLARGELASAATLAAQALAAAAPHGGDVVIFDLDEHKRARYAERGFGVFAYVDGFDVLADPQRHGFDLIVLDPYEFIWHYPDYLPTILELARRTDVLIYIYDKAPSAPGYRRNITNFLADLDRGRPDGRYLLGRAPSDGFLPQIYHEMLYLPAETTTGLASVAARLRHDTQALATHIISAHQHLRGRLA